MTGWCATTCCIFVLFGHGRVYSADIVLIILNHGSVILAIALSARKKRSPMPIEEIKLWYLKLLQMAIIVAVTTRTIRPRNTKWCSAIMRPTENVKSVIELSVESSVVYSVLNWGN